MGGAVIFNQHLGRRKGCPTKRAATMLKIRRFKIFLVPSFFCSQAESTRAPVPVHANGWALALIVKLIRMANHESPNRNTTNTIRFIVPRHSGIVRLFSNLHQQHQDCEAQRKAGAD
jgi:hypothetical protein